jgi:hypothetical protein
MLWHNGLKSSMLCQHSKQIDLTIMLIKLCNPCFQMFLPSYIFMVTLAVLQWTLLVADHSNLFHDLMEYYNVKRPTFVMLSGFDMAWNLCLDGTMCSFISYQETNISDVEQHLIKDPYSTLRIPNIHLFCFKSYLCD